MKLKRLCKQLPHLSIYGSKEVEITGICSDSRLAVPGNLFVAKKGHHCDGVDFVAEALEAGCVALLTDLYDPNLRSIVQIVVPDVAAIESALADAFYSHPSAELFVIGITGTDGKTTTSYLTHFLYHTAEEPCGLLGTVEYLVGPMRRNANLTTPEAVTLHKMFREMRKENSYSCVMEVSSHSLVQQRVANVRFDVAILTNISHEHLDYHKTMEAYVAAKRSFFVGNPPLKAPKLALLNIDDAFGRQWQAECPHRVFTYGFDTTADLKIANCTPLAGAIAFDLTWRHEQVRCTLPMLGCYNSYNAAAALLVGLDRGISLRQMCAKLATFPGVPGRLEKVAEERGCIVYLDFAHTPQALEKALDALQFHYPHRKLHLLFGCGGERDKTKRPLMAAIAEKKCTRITVTSDNPRHEAPEAIIADICAGFHSLTNVQVVIDRKDAIERALAVCEEGSILLIAGKGHEKHQSIAGHNYPFDEGQQVQEVLRALSQLQECSL